MTIELHHAAFRAAIEDVGAAAHRLRADRDRIGREVGELLDGGWSGRAATAYAEGWAEWLDGSGDVLAGLDAMADLLEAVHRDLAERDADSERDLAVVATRLVRRLG